jgi:hypothetical protein
MAADRLLINFSLQMVLGEDLNDIRLLGRLACIHGLETILDRLLKIRACLKLRNNNIDPAVAQIQGLTSALDTITNNGNGLAF